ncbi:MAG: AI-2E family transporter [Oscillospiraceae bacterium]|nr:AI-2E family transporter [Oscillospiraceae bacterium]
MNRYKLNKKHVSWGITAFCVIVACIAFFWILQRWAEFHLAVVSAMSVLSPFVWGFVIAYLLTPMVRWFQSKIFEPPAAKIFKRKNRTRRIFVFSRTPAVIISILIMYLVIAALLWLILPQVYHSIDSILRNMTLYVSVAENWIESILENYPEAEEYVITVLGDVSSGIATWLRNSILPFMGRVISGISTGMVFVLKGVYDILIGTVVSAYVLFNKETFAAQSKKVLYSIFKKENVRKILYALKFTDRTIMGFVSGKLLDSLIIGILCYICCSVLQMPYVLLVSVIIGITNIIPFFGPFIGAVPCALIILMVSPMQCLVFVIFIILLQQLDGNVIGPKILGSTVGINGFWIMFSIILGAGLFGFVGMLLGVPVFTVIYAGFRYIINARLKKRGLPSDTARYKPKGVMIEKPFPEDEVTRGQ